MDKVQEFARRLESTITSDESYDPRRCRRCRARGFPFAPAPDDAWCTACREKLVNAIAAMPPVYFDLEPPRPPDRKLMSVDVVTFCGGTGTWKSTYAAHIARDRAHLTGKLPRWINVPKLMVEIRASWREKFSTTELAIISRCTGAEILVMDDLGAERVNDLSVSDLLVIVSERIERRRPTIVTSNLTLQQIADRLDDRIADRLKRAGEVILMEAS